MDDFVDGVKKKTVIVLDNAPWHKSEKMDSKKKEWKDKGVELFFLPPYCPHLNMIETLWRKMKHEWLRPQDFNSKEAMHTRIAEILDNYGSSLFDINFNLCEMLT